MYSRLPIPLALWPLCGGCWLSDAEIGAVLGGSDTDGPVVDGTIDDLGPGDLLITELMRNPTAAEDFTAEWFEVHNATARAVDLEGLWVYDDDTDEFTVSEPLVVPAGGLVVLAASANRDVNGDVVVDYAWRGFALANDEDEIVLANADGPIDAVRWSPTWPGAAGASMSLDPDRLDPDDNDVLDAWCDGESAYGDGDLGTPGAENEACP